MRVTIDWANMPTYNTIMFAAPPQEPISGAFAAYPMVEATFMSGLIAVIGVGAFLFPFGLSSVATEPARAGGFVRVIGAAWGVGGLVLGLFGVMNYFTHIGLIVNTM